MGCVGEKRMPQIASAAVIGKVAPVFLAGVLGGAAHAVPCDQQNITHAHSEARDQASLDRDSISDQLARYAQLWDRKDAKAFSLLFTEGATMEWYFAGVPREAGPVVGRPAIFEYAVTSHEGRLAGRQTRHHFSSLVFEKLSPEFAKTENTFMLTHQLPGQEPNVRLTGIYRIEWSKVGREWLIAKRTLFVDQPATTFGQ